jgi:hypothetical protein
VLCSRCSEPIRPIVCLDIDGTMGEYHEHFIRFALGYMGQESHAALITSKYDGTEPMGVWFSHFFDTDIRTYRDIKLAYRQGAQKRNMPVRPWASNLTHLIRERVEIWITTTRPYLRLDGVDPDTRFWLHHNAIYYDHLLYHEDKYNVLATRVDSQRVAAVVDDLPEDLKVAERCFGYAATILFRAFHNRHFWDGYGPSNIAWDGQTVKMLIDRRVDSWYERFGTHGILEESRSQA